ncbi:MAG TPA: histidine phosphatase family protein [Gaiellaceae bacterium]|nr:histidine phosphatase family protein [Gaiellaceae bacterium]
MERALFVRHGESEFSVRALVNGDPAVHCGLTELGRRQARQLGERLAGEPIGLCVVTEFLRTHETADLVLGDRQIPRLVVPELNDPFYGEFEGRPLADYRRWAAAHTPSDMPEGGGESRVAIASRYARGFRILLGRAEATLLVVCHSLPIAYAVASADGRGPRARMPLVTYAEPHVLSGDQLERAAEGLDAWTRNPVFT